MLAKTLYTLLPVGLALASPLTKLAERAPNAAYNPGGFSVQAAGPPFLTLDNDIGFYFQTDGNFVVYQGASVASNALFNSGTAGHACADNNCTLVFQSDGNLVIYVNNSPVRATNTVNDGASLLEFRDLKPYVAIYGNGDHVLWSSGQPSSVICERPSCEGNPP